MGLFDSGASGDMQNSYDQSQQYLNPYMQGGNQMFSQLQGYTNQLQNNLSQYGTEPADYMYRQINQSPMTYYNTIMGSYSESPEAKYMQQQALRAADAGASASGMMGSGAFFKGIQQNANDIAQRDRNNYFGNIMNTNNMQMQYLGDYRNQQNAYRNMLMFGSNLGYGAAGQMSNNAMEYAKMQQQQDQINQANAMGMGGLFGGLVGGYPGSMAGKFIGGLFG